VNINNAIKSAMENYRAGNLQQAASICMDILKIKPSYVYALNLLGEILYQCKDYDSANLYFKQALKYQQDMHIKIQLATEYLLGKGIEFGALHSPLPINQEKAKVVYADRLTKMQALKLFPELEESEQWIIEPELIIDLNTDDLSSLVNYDFDFFIANHCIEHLVNPIRFLRDISLIMKKGSILFLTVPNKEYTFDKNRKLTDNGHLWQDYLNNEAKISDEHIEDFLLYKEEVQKIHPAIVKYFNENGLPLNYFNGNKLPANLFEREKLFNFHRERSIHVHVWNKSSFDGFLTWINDKLKLQYNVLKTHDSNKVADEMIYLLKKD
jgi:tetratricopeptide (TPR) repeat protein